MQECWRENTGTGTDKYIQADEPSIPEPKASIKLICSQVQTSKTPEQDTNTGEARELGT